jgi:hypothetical protein
MVAGYIPSFTELPKTYYQEDDLAAFARMNAVSFKDSGYDLYERKHFGANLTAPTGYGQFHQQTQQEQLLADLSQFTRKCMSCEF